MMKKLYAFIAPKRDNKRSEEYEVSILESIAQKFDLGLLLRYESYQYGDLIFLNGEFERGKVKVRFKEGKEGLAEVIKYGKVRGFRVWL